MQAGSFSLAVSGCERRIGSDRKRPARSACSADDRPLSRGKLVSHTAGHAKGSRSLVNPKVPLLLPHRSGDDADQVAERSCGSPAGRTKGEEPASGLGSETKTETPGILKADSSPSGCSRRSAAQARDQVPTHRRGRSRLPRSRRRSRRSADPHPPSDDASERLVPKWTRIRALIGRVG